MIKEVLIVEGKMDVAAINKAVEADCIITGGFTLNKHTLNDIAAAYNRRGIIILTDPDSAGERIRKFLTKRFPNAKHAFVPKIDATANNDIGIEQASPKAIQTALKKVRTLTFEPTQTFTNTDMMKYNLNGSRDSAERRMKLGAILGIGFANAKNFLKRLNNYGVSREEFTAALQSLQ